jgi:hypothetical protein
LLVRRREHLLLVNHKLAHLLLQLRQLLGKPCYLRGQRLRRLLPVSRVKLAQIARDALLQLGAPPFHLRPCEVLIPVVHGFELAAIDGDTRRHEETHLSAEFDEARTYLAQRQAIVFAEVRDRLVIRCEPTQQPHDLDIASSFSFEPPARLNPVQIAVNVKLKENRGVVRGPTSCRRLHSLKAHLSQIERIDKHIDHANRVALVNEVIEAFGQQRPLPTIRLFNEAPHQFPHRITGES